MKSYTHFTLEERICIEEMRKKDKKLHEIAEVLGENKSTISRELKRNSNKQGNYNFWGAHLKAKARRHNSVRQPRIKKIQNCTNTFAKKWISGGHQKSLRKCGKRSIRKSVFRLQQFTEQ